MQTSTLFGTCAAPTSAHTPVTRRATLRLAVVLGFSIGCSSPSLLAQSDYATPYAITTLAGSAQQTGSTNGSGSAARFNEPEGVAVDGSGNVYVADTVNNLIRKITPYGVVTTLAGSVGGGSSNGTGSAAEFYQPHGVATDLSGNVYVADSGNNTIRKITSSGVVTTLAGSGTEGTLDGTGTLAQFGGPCGLAVDSHGIVYVADTSNNSIRKITPSGVVTTFAGVSGLYTNGSSDGSGRTASFDLPNGIAVDSSGNVYVADSGNGTIRKITAGGVVTTFAGTAGQIGSSDGSGATASFDGIDSVAVDGSGKLYVPDFQNSLLRKITPGGIVTTLAGSLDSYGTTDGTGSAALFHGIVGVAADSRSTVYVADQENSTIRKGTLAPDLFGGAIAGVNLNYSSWFGYYTTLGYPLVYEYSLGYEYVFPGGSGVYLFDYKSGHFFYTQNSYYPFVYDFTLGTYLYYYPGNGNPRYFYDYGTSKVISE